jgi:hypothetical protein
VASGSEGEDESADDAKGGWHAIAARMAARTQAGSSTQPESNVRVLNIGSGRDTKPKGRFPWVLRAYRGIALNEY